MSEETNVMKAGQQASLGEIRKGDDIRARYSGSGDSPELTHIEVTSAEAGDEATAAGAERSK